MSSSEPFQDQFKRRVQVRLEKAKVEIEFDGPDMLFHTSNSLGSLFRFDSLLLSSVPRGKFTFSDEGRVGYCLDFTEMCLWLTALVLGLFGFFFLVIVSGPVLLRLIVVVSLWFVMIGGNYIFGIYRFNQFVNRILSDMK